MTNDTTTTPIGLLTGKVVFITGASRGIGAAAARLFTDEGAAVVLAARGTGALDKIVDEIRGSGGVADAVTVDLADRASVRAAVERAERAARPAGRRVQQRRGDPDSRDPLDTTSDEDIENQFAVNFRGHWVGDERRSRTHAAEARGGAIVNTSSIGSRRANPALPGVRGHEARPEQHHRDRGGDVGGGRASGSTASPPAAPRRR